MPMYVYIYMPMYIYSWSCASRTEARTPNAPGMHDDVPWYA